MIGWFRAGRSYLDLRKPTGDEIAEPIGGVFINFGALADWVGDALVFIEYEDFVDSVRCHGHDGLGVGGGHGVDELGLTDHIEGEGLGVVVAQFDIHRSENLCRLVGGGHARRGGDACAGDVGGDGGGFLLGELVLGDGFGHRAAAGVAGADEEDGAFEVLEDIAFREDAFIADTDASVEGDMNGGGVVLVVGRAVVEDEGWLSVRLALVETGWNWAQVGARVVVDCPARGSDPSRDACNPCAAKHLTACWVIGDAEGDLCSVVDAVARDAEHACDDVECFVGLFEDETGWAGEESIDEASGGWCIEHKMFHNRIEIR